MALNNLREVGDIRAVRFMLQDRITAVQAKIAEAAHKAGRQPEEITLVAVTKTWPPEVLLAAYAAGLRHFGENRTNELTEKRPFLEAQLGAEAGITWHAIGTLQSRQADGVADCADVFHALDRLKIAQKLAGRLAVNGRSLPVFLEVNVSGEASKAGFACMQWETDSQQKKGLLTAVQAMSQLPGLRLQGLMTMAPWEATEKEIRQVFRRTRLLVEWLRTELPHVPLHQLSMGMTDDFPLAIEEGATHVRVGRALFGVRTP